MATSAVATQGSHLVEKYTINLIFRISKGTGIHPK